MRSQCCVQTVYREPSHWDYIWINNQIFFSSLSSGMMTWAKLYCTPVIFRICVTSSTSAYTSISVVYLQMLFKPYFKFTWCTRCSELETALVWTMNLFFPLDEGDIEWNSLQFGMLTREEGWISLRFVVSMLGRLRQLFYFIKILVRLCAPTIERSLHVPNELFLFFTISQTTQSMCPGRKNGFSSILWAHQLDFIWLLYHEMQPTRLRRSLTVLSESHWLRILTHVSQNGRVVSPNLDN